MGMPTSRPTGICVVTGRRVVGAIAAVGKPRSTGRSICVSRTTVAPCKRFASKFISSRRSSACSIS
jgi:hypothetical protein